jgi:hypothetical protein
MTLTRPSDSKLLAISNELSVDLSSTTRYLKVRIALVEHALDCLGNEGFLVVKGNDY